MLVCALSSGAFWQRTNAILTIQGLRVEPRGPLGVLHLLATCLIVELRPEDERVGLVEVGDSARVQGRDILGVPVLGPDGRRVVFGVEWALGLSIAEADAEHGVGIDGQIVGVQKVVLGVVGVCAANVELAGGLVHGLYHFDVVAAVVGVRLAARYALLRISRLQSDGGILLSERTRENLVWLAKVR